MYLRPLFPASLISDIFLVIAILSSLKVKKRSFRGPEADLLEGCHGLARGLSAVLFGLQLGSPTPRAAFEDVAVV